MTGTAFYGLLWPASLGGILLYRKLAELPEALRLRSEPKASKVYQTAIETRLTVSAGDRCRSDKDSLFQFDEEHLRARLVLSALRFLAQES